MARRYEPTGTGAARKQRLTGGAYRKDGQSDAGTPLFHADAWLQGTAGQKFSIESFTV